MSIRHASLLMFISGLFSLSYEILLFRFHTVASGSLPEVFGMVLGIFLIGIAIGARVAQRFLRRSKEKLSELVRRIFLFASLVGYLLFPVIAQLSILVPSGYNLSLFLILPFSVAAGMLFPLLSQLGARSGESAGRDVAFLYFANIVGSTLGSVMTGLWLLDTFSFSSTVTIVSTLSLFGAIFASPRLAPGIALPAGLAVMYALLTPLMYGNFYEKIYYQVEYEPSKRFADLVENKSGVIFVDQDGAVFGDGVYDGHFRISLHDDANRIFRAFSIFCVDRSPETFLSIGLGSGSWLQVIANGPGVRSLTAIEINPGYLELIKKRPVVQSLLDNPRFQLHITDGRRWLEQNPDKKYDFILLNTSWHFRSNATNLLSREFLESLKDHLNPGGLIYMNWTYSLSVLRTVATVFPYAGIVENSVFASSEPFAPDQEKCEQMYESFRIDGLPVIGSETADDELRARLALIPYRGSREEILEKTSEFDVVTEDNLRTEFPGLGASREFDAVPEFQRAEESLAGDDQSS